MSSDVPCIDDKRGLIFTINHDTGTVYQVTSSTWADTSNRWGKEMIPQAIRDKVAELAETGKPGAFVRFVQGELGVYVICEKNIQNMPAEAGDDLVIETPQPPDRALADYDIVVCAKGGTARGESGETLETHEGDYYVVGCRTWCRVVLEEPARPKFVETTKEILVLLDALNGKNFLSMAPDPLGERLPPDLPPSSPTPVGINCYVLNLARFIP